ncbi:hypothetical protein [Pinirhizobacter soli]|uniref:hypothetical protein n=1 Tax=Pinirhizobacter soli TaxID=2786953 RepID=UPI00202A3CE7|nr:hypothetical protein [Pinirhizobacter soli]
MTAIFLADTNFFLQCDWQGHLDWSLVTEEADVRLAVSKEVRRELDYHKSGGNQRRARRARAVASELGKLPLGDEETLRLTPEGVKVHVWLMRAPWVEIDDEASHLKRLDLKRTDERIAAEAYEISRLPNWTHLVMLSHDMIPLEIAASLGLRHQRVPDAWLLPPEPDETAQELRRLQQRLTQLEGRAPALTVDMGGLDPVCTFAYFPALSSDLIDRLMVVVAERAGVSGWANRIIHSSSDNSLAATIGSVQRRYQTEVVEWLNGVREDLTHIHVHLMAETPGHALGWSLANTGEAGAHHLIVSLALHGAFHLADDEDEPPLFFFEEPPELPGSFLTQLQSTRRAKRRAGSLSIDTFLPRFMPTPAMAQHRHKIYWADDDVEKPKVTTGTCEDFRHGVDPLIRSFAIKPDMSTDQTIAGAIKVTVSADNLTSAITRTFPIRLVPSHYDTLAEVLVRLKTIGLEVIASDVAEQR